MYKNFSNYIGLKIKSSRFGLIVNLDTLELMPY
ncbi:hypothetical protein N479_25670 [Pseudoalteromonas luteoviolacea S4054]|uniref:Uncharacterized protein n=1 Tax=Pseudoalteromonas luteoviolacea S4054 TaxID=1129367 RepID=A0A0F6AHC4_9GAMM|nr:hypothetical protein N479_25670 [Pseudoalteromonas luteoviolacea S4054]